MKCDHSKIKKNFSHGKKSRATKHCKICGAVITNKEIKFLNKKKWEERRKFNR